VAVLLPGVKPAPESPTFPEPDTPELDDRVRLGAARIVIVLDAAKPDASRTVTFSTCGAVVLGIMIAAFAAATPVALVVMVVVLAVVAVLYHVVAVPFSQRVRVELAEKSTPLIGTTVGGLTAVRPPVKPNVARNAIDGLTVKLVAAVEVPAVYVIVCVPAGVEVEADRLAFW